MSVYAYVRERDDNRCQVCGLQGLVEVHHIRARSRQYGATFDIDDPNNLVCLCREHHAACTRNKLVVVRIETSPGVWSAFWEEI